MQKVKIPITIDPRNAAARKLDCRGVVEPGDFPRLSSMVDELAGDIEVQVSFYRDATGLDVFAGRASVPAVMRCQRCLEPMTVTLSAEFRYAVDPEEVVRLGLEDQFDVAELNGLGEILLCDIIEDELILSLPIVARHPLQDCPAADLLQDQEADGGPEPEERHNPFAALGEMIRNGNSSNS